MTDANHERHDDDDAEADAAGRAELEALGVRLMSYALFEQGAEATSVRVHGSFKSGADRIVVARVCGTKPGAPPRWERFHLLAVRDGTTRRLTLHSQSVEGVVAGLADAAEASARERFASGRGAPRWRIFSVVPFLLVEFALARGLSLATIVGAATRAFLELDPERREELLEVARLETEARERRRAAQPPEAA